MLPYDVNKPEWVCRDGVTYNLILVYAKQMDNHWKGMDLLLNRWYQDYFRQYMYPQQLWYDSLWRESPGRNCYVNCWLASDDGIIDLGQFSVYITEQGLSQCEKTLHM